MSVQAIGWVFDHSPAKGSDRLVLLSIANHAGQSPEDGAWEAWPGIDTMAREAGLDRPRTVRDALGRLEAAGAVERIINGAPDERIRRDRRPNLYRVLLDNGGPCGDPRCRWCTGGRVATERGDATRRDGGTRRGATGGRDASPEPSVEPSEEPSLEPNHLRLATPPPPDRFAEFWTSYPRRVDKGGARKAWAAAVKLADPAVIIAGAVRYAAETKGREPRHIAHPATWLRGERWLDEPGGNAGRPAGPRTPTPDRGAPEGRLVL